MKILQVQIQCPDEAQNQHLIPGLCRSKLANCLLEKYSFFYVVIGLSHKYLLSIYSVSGTVWALEPQW